MGGRRKRRRRRRNSCLAALLPCLRRCRAGLQCAVRACIPEHDPGAWVHRGSINPAHRVDDRDTTSEVPSNGKPADQGPASGLLPASIRITLVTWWARRGATTAAAAKRPAAWQGGDRRGRVLYFSLYCIALFVTVRKMCRPRRQWMLNKGASRRGRWV